MPPLEEPKVKKLLVALYGRDEGETTYHKLQRLVERKLPFPPPKKSLWDERDLWLITYGDTLSEPHTAPLATLKRFLETAANGSFSFVHILPFFPFSSDDGFSVVDYREVDPKLGRWDHIQDLSAAFRPVFDAVINHVSSGSRYMQRYQQGTQTRGPFFIEVQPEDDLSKVVRPRALPLTHEFSTPSGPKPLWTTFSRDQVDLNFANPEVLLELLDVLLFYAKKGAEAFRLDAIAYLWKEPGTSCIHHPKTHIVVKLIRALIEAVCPGRILLTETNVPHAENTSYFGEGDDEAHLVYNFTLAPLLLHCIHKGDATALTRWAARLDERSGATAFLNFTASHDGVGVRPTEGLLTKKERQDLVETTLAHGGKVSTKQNPDGSQTPYELNITYFDALNPPDGDDDLETQVARFMVSQAVALAFKGIPAVYIHSLLGSRNDYDGVEETGRARSINRKKLSYPELLVELETPESPRARVFRKYMELLKCRKRTPAFHPDSPQEVLDLHPGVFALCRGRGEKGQVYAFHNLTGEPVSCSVGEKLGPAPRLGDLLYPQKTPKLKNGKLELRPYEVSWLTPSG